MIPFQKIYDQLVRGDRQKRDDRILGIGLCNNKQLSVGGWMVFTTITKDAPTYGQNTRIGKDRFEMFGGVRMYFYDMSSILQDFSNAGLVDIQKVRENYPFYLVICQKKNRYRYYHLNVMDNKYFETIIIGGSYAGLSAAMALGRSQRKTLIIDSGEPCNRFTPHSHNFITQDGEIPSVIAYKAKKQVLAYDTVRFMEDAVEHAQRSPKGFVVTTASGQTFEARKLLFATGIKDLMPDVEGFAACWGKSVIHCPYCHGYEVRGMMTGIWANGSHALHYAQLVRQLTKDLLIMTDGTPTFTEEQQEQLDRHGIGVAEKKIASLIHEDGNLRAVVFKDGSKIELQALYARPDFEQHCTIPASLGCELIEQGLIKIDSGQRTSVPGVFACGDNSSPLRSVANAVATGNLAGAMINKELAEEAF